MVVLATLEASQPIRIIDGDSSIQTLEFNDFDTNSSLIMLSCMCASGCPLLRDASMTRQLATTFIINAKLYVPTSDYIRA